MKPFLGSFVLAAMAVGASGCATIVAKSSQVVTVTSEPPGAAVSVTNRAGRVVHSASTPFTVTLKKGAGYFKPELYTLRFSREGFEARQVVLRGGVSGWYFGNILIGGLIGMLAVDPATGAMFKLKPGTVDVALDALKLAQKPAAGSLLVVMTPSLPVSILEPIPPIAAH